MNITVETENNDTSFEELLEHLFSVLYEKLAGIGLTDEDIEIVMERFVTTLNNEEFKKRASEAIGTIMLDYLDFSDIPGLEGLSEEVLHE